MKNFYRLRDFLEKDKLWTNEKEQHAFIKKVTRFVYTYVPSSMLGTIYPFSSKMPAQKWMNEFIEDCVSKKYPLPSLPLKPIEQITESEWKKYIWKLLDTLENQVNETMRMIYKVNDENEEEFDECKHDLYQRFKNVCRFNFISSICLILYGLFIITLLIAKIGYNHDISDNVSACILPITIFLFVFIIMSPLIKSKYLKLNKFK